MQRSFKEYLIISLKGLAMGAADVVPGVSGGTIAFISGIYEELLESINAVNFNALKTLKSEGFKAMWKSINGNFLFSLVLGIGISIVSFAKLIKWLLENEPILVWSFFFGLVIASVIFVAKQIKKWNFMTIFMLLIGTGIGYYITILPPMAGNYTSNWFFFIAGSLAICAMILPGISGGFILLILGAYKPALDALHDRDIKTILLLISGAVVGLLTFSRLLKWIFDKYHTLTLAVLTGFILGSLNKIWPWKEILTWRTNSHGVKVPFSEKSISPFTYEGNPELLWAVILAIIGFLVIVLLEKSATIKTN
jgi:putative membrane protein